MEVGLLGPVLLRVDGAIVAVPSAPQRIVLARMVLAPANTATVAALVDAVWAGKPPANADNNLQIHISRLRKAVGVDRIRWTPGGYRLTVDDTDIAEAERLVAAAGTAQGCSRHRPGLGSVARRALSDLPDPLAFAPELARLPEWRAQLYEQWFDLRVCAGQAGLALPDLESAVAADPLREPLRLLHSRALYQQGRTAEALGVLDAFRRRLADESGLDPSRELAELQRRILADDPALRPPTTGPPEAPRRRPLDRFVGRAEDLAGLRSALTRRRLVTVVGPGGVGKTRLALELLARRDPGERAHLVELGAVSTGSDIAGAVADAFGLRVAPAGIESAIADAIGSARTLLVLDNCEHVLDGARNLAAELFGSCAGLRVLATSRRRLEHPGEQVVRLGPLEPHESEQLFLDRAALPRADFDPASAREITRDICHTLAGLPLALELAARREAVFGLAQLRDRLAAGLEVLDPARDGKRTNAVTATVEWSYRLLVLAATK